jgi:hypothetical protein
MDPEVIKHELDYRTLQLHQAKRLTWILILLVLILATSAFTLGSILIDQESDRAHQQYLTCVNLYAHGVRAGSCEIYRDRIERDVKFKR